MPDIFDEIAAKDQAPMGDIFDRVASQQAAPVQTKDIFDQVYEQSQPTPSIGPDAGTYMTRPVTQNEIARANEAAMASVPTTFQKVKGALMDSLIPKDKIKEYSDKAGEFFKGDAGKAIMGAASPLTNLFDLMGDKAAPEIRSELARKSTELAASFVSPAGIATLGLGALPKAAQAAVGYGFAADILSQAPEKADAIFSAKSPKEYTAAIFDAATTLGMGLGVLGHAAGRPGTGGITELPRIAYEDISFPAVKEQALETTAKVDSTISEVAVSEPPPVISQRKPVGSVNLRDQEELIVQGRMEAAAANAPRGELNININPEPYGSVFDLPKKGGEPNATQERPITESSQPERPGTDTQRQAASPSGSNSIEQSGQGAPSIDTQIKSAYEDIVGNSGFIDVNISELQKRTGLPMKEVQNWVRKQSREGNAVPSRGDWSLSSEEVRKGGIELGLGENFLDRMHLKVRLEPEFRQAVETTGTPETQPIGEQTPMTTEGSGGSPTASAQAVPIERLSAAQLQDRIDVLLSKHRDADNQTKRQIWSEVQALDKQYREATGQSMGPGAASIEDFVAQRATGLKKAVVADERIQRGLDDLPPAERQSEAARVSAAEDLVDKDATVAPTLIKRIVDDGDTAVGPDEAAVLLVERTRLMNEREMWQERLANGEEVEAATERLGRIETEMERLDRAQRMAGSTWGRVGHLYQRMMKADFSLEAMESRARAAKQGPLTEPEIAKLKEDAQRVADLEKKVEATDSADIQAQEVEASKSLVEQTIKEVEGLRFDKRVFQIADNIVKKWESSLEADYKDLRSRLARTSTGVDPTILFPLTRIIRAKVGRLGLNLAEMTAHLVAEFGEGIRPFIPEAWDNSEKLIDKQVKDSATRSRIKAGVSKADKTVVDAKARAKAEAAAGEGVSQKTVYELVRSLIKQGVHGEPDLMKAAHQVLKEIFPNLTERDVRRAFTDYGKAKFPSKEAVAAELRETKTLVRLQESIDRETEGLPSLRTGPQRDKATQSIREKQQKLNELLKKRKGPPSPEQLASRNEATVTRLKNAIADLDKQLRTGEKPPGKGTSAPDTPEIDRLKAERDAMKAKLDEIEAEANPPKSAAEKQVEQLSKIRQRLDETLSGERDAKATKPFETLSRAAEDIKLEIEAMKELAAQMRRDARPKSDPAAARERAQIKALEEAIERYRVKTANSDFSSPPKSTVPDSRRVAALKEIRDSRRSMYEVAKKAGRPVLTPEEKYNQARSAQIRRDYERAKDRLKKGDFSPVTKKSMPALTKANLDAKAELEKVKNEIRQREKEWQLENRTKAEKAKAAALELVQSARGIILGSDIGVLTRQGLFSWSRPTTAIKATAEAFKSALSPSSMARWEIEVRDREVNGKAAGPIRKAAGLRLTDRINHPEELVVTRLLSRIPDFNVAGKTIKLSEIGKTLERFQTTFINAVRADLFDAAIKQGLTPEELKLRANFINSATGSSNIKQVHSVLSTILTSPRYEASRWEMLTQPVRNVGALAKSGIKGELNRAALANIQDLAVTAAGVIGLFKVAGLAGYTVNWNPTSSDFLKMRKGDETWDVTAGLAPRIRDAMRLYVAYKHPDYNHNFIKEFGKALGRTVSPGIKTPLDQSSAALQRAAGVKEPKLPFSGFKSDEEAEGWMALAPLIVQSMSKSMDDGIGQAVFTGAREFVGSAVNRYKKPKDEPFPPKN